MQPKDAAIRKRSQIAKANRMMFVWVAVVSVVVGFALVGSIFLVEKLLFNERVLAAKQKTVDVLQADNTIVPSLEDQVRVLDTNTALNSIKANSSDQAVQVILDALPSDANSLALGASLQDKLLANIPNLSLTSLQVDPVVGLETSTADAAVSIGATGTAGSTVGNAITFTFAVTGSQDALKQVLTNLEKSIRAIDVTSLQIASQTSTTDAMTVQGEAFYEPAVVVQLKNETVN
jgi:hypothetical protein